MARLTELFKIVKSLSQQEKAELIATTIHLLTAKVVSILLNKLLLAHIVNPQKLLKTACVIQFKDLSAKTATSLSQFAPTQLQNIPRNHLKLGLNSLNV